MPKKKKNPTPELEPIPPVDEAEFTDVIRKMVNTSPLTREDAEGGRGFRRKRNPPTKLALCFPEVPSKKKRRG